MTVKSPAGLGVLGLPTAMGYTLTTAPSSSSASWRSGILMTIWRTGPGVLLWAADGFAGARRESCSSASCSALSESRSFETATCGFCGSTFFAVSVVAGVVFGLNGYCRVLENLLSSAQHLAVVEEMVPNK